ncbi:hypothetical protein CRE_23024 [Caenorhabditis remanei]|uniref:Uncharacterized protein n=1 Tax=Caenorhabditis remanei TaxID=31234 RepID=E3N4E8_CAERE|nr:hypothetical protein CRE_23024 [Caenorhabditis remanei]
MPKSDLSYTGPLRPARSVSLGLLAYLWMALNSTPLPAQNQEDVGTLTHGKDAPPMASEEIMEFIPDYGNGVIYLDDDLKQMGIAILIFN